jgi:hypothetical protein
MGKCGEAEMRFSGSLVYSLVQWSLPETAFRGNTPPGDNTRLSLF